MSELSAPTDAPACVPTPAPTPAPTPTSSPTPTPELTAAATQTWWQSLCLSCVASPNRWWRGVSWTIAAGILAGVLHFLLAGVASQENPVNAQDLPPSPLAQRFKAPPLEGGLAWLNTAGPIELSKLKGKIVLLDFWTFCCINCIHVLPDLAKLEKEFANELVVIGVHSAKFEGERDTVNIRSAILRYGIEHPVVNDGNQQIWSSYNVRSWPTLVLIDPEGYYLGYVSGELSGNKLDVLRDVINKLIAHHSAKGTLDRTPLHFQQEQFGVAQTPLRYPGKLLADEANDRLFVADSSHNRLVILEISSGRVLSVIGNGQAELKDGHYETASFNDPQGMALTGDTLFVADRKNHALRKVDLKAKTVTTLAGNGKRGFEGGEGFYAGVQPNGYESNRFELASPWDLLLVGNNLYIAMAGTHQIWRFDVTTQRLFPFAGNGMENIRDGLPNRANLAQPSGLSSDGQYLYVADSEVSAIRKIRLQDGYTETIVGTGLFDFGDRDGTGDSVRLQHCLDVEYYRGTAFPNGTLLVADTYNNKIKTIDPRTNTAQSYLGGKQPIDPQGTKLDEPAGLSLGQDRLYVADTNNHAIRVIDLQNAQVRTISPVGLGPPQVQELVGPLPNVQQSQMAPQTLAADQTITVSGAVVVPAGFKLNPSAPMRWQLDTVAADGRVNFAAQGKLPKVQPDFSFTFDAKQVASAASLRVSVIYYPCEVGSEGVCKIQTQQWQFPVQFDASGTNTLNLIVNP